jgi:hypothetical protein
MTMAQLNLEHLTHQKIQLNSFPKYVEMICS